jgi:hypothetical protein
LSTVLHRVATAREGPAKNARNPSAVKRLSYLRDNRNVFVRLNGGMVVFWSLPGMSPSGTSSSAPKRVSGVDGGASLRSIVRTNVR